jgi:hypothetical protein
MVLRPEKKSGASRKSPRNAGLSAASRQSVRLEAVTDTDRADHLRVG